jgi:hypothetical protein
MLTMDYVLTRLYHILLRPKIPTHDMVHTCLNLHLLEKLPKITLRLIRHSYEINRI